MCKVMQHYEDIARKEGILSGIQQGIQQGIEQGIQEEKIRNAVALLKAGADPVMVSHCLNMSLSQVQEIALSLTSNAEIEQIQVN